MRPPRRLRRSGWPRSGRPSAAAKVGHRGDYFTNVSVGPLFGKLLALQFGEIWQQLGSPQKFVITEQGAHTGDFARDVLAALGEISPDCLEAIEYRIIEPFPILSEHQKQSLVSFSGKVKWFGSPQDFEPFVGIHFSNELFDALPVHIVCRRALTSTATQECSTVQWVEKHVGLENEQFAFVELPIGNPRLEEYLRNMPMLPPDAEMDVNLAALEVIDALAAETADLPGAHEAARNVRASLAAGEAAARWAVGRLAGVAAAAALRESAPAAAELFARTRLENESGRPRPLLRIPSVKHERIPPG